MRTRQIQTKKSDKKDIIIHNFDKSLENVLRAMGKELSAKNVELIIRYDKEMIRRSLARDTRLKHLLIILSLSRILKKDWEEDTRTDIEELVFQFMQMFSANGKETNHTWDHKKILKIFLDG